MKKILSVTLSFLCLLGTINMYGCNNFSQREEKLYNLILDVSYEFKNPKSVRIISGTCEYFPDIDDSIYAFLRISAKNGFNAETDGYYFCWYNDEGKVCCADLGKVGTATQIQKCNERDDFDIKKINTALDNYWK